MRDRGEKHDQQQLGSSRVMQNDGLEGTREAQFLRRQKGDFSVVIDGDAIVRIAGGVSIEDVGTVEAVHSRLH